MDAAKFSEIPIVGFVENKFGTFGIVAALTAIITIGYIAATWETFYPDIKIVGMENQAWYNPFWLPAKIRFTTGGRKIIFDGLSKCKGAFQTMTTFEPVIFFPMRYANELKGQPDLSLNGFTKKEFLITYPGFEGAGASTQGTIVQDTVRLKLTQSLNLVTKDLTEETDMAISETFGNDPEWKETIFAQVAPTMIARLSTRVFLGPDFARDPVWLKIATDYTFSLMICSRLMKIIPAPLRPFLHRFLPPMWNIRKQESTARKMIETERHKRREAREKAAASGKIQPKLIDSLAWMEELQAARGHAFDFAGGQLGLTFAAIHTTSDMVLKVMYNVLEYPEYFQPLRDEMLDCLKRNGWKKTSLFEMKLLDSFMKETQRLMPASMTAVNRVAEANIRLEDGTMIPKGASIKVAMDRHFSDEIYPEPEKFDGYRYMKLRQEPGQENNWQFVTPSDAHIGFGLGQHACPGRFFASNEIKICLVFLLLKYDWKFKPGRKPVPLEIGIEVVGDQNCPLLYRRRREEVDLFSLIDN